MNIDELVAELEREYDADTGFIGRLRFGHFDQEGLVRLLELLKKCPAAADEATVDSRLVRLLWWMPWIVEWQAQRLTEEGKAADRLRRAGTSIFSELERILGVA